MLGLRKWAVVLLLAVATVAGSLIPPPRQQIHAQQEKASSYERAEKGQPAFVFLIIDGTLDIGKGFVRFLGANATEIAAAITALATIAIAWFTLTLRAATDRLWSAGKDQLRVAERTLTELERPYMYLKIKQSGLQTDANALVAARNRLEYSFKNTGRTVAHSMEHAFRIAIEGPGKFPDPIDPDNPPATDVERFPAGVIVEPNDHHEPPVRDLRLYDDDAKWQSFAAPGKRSQLFMLGYFRYGDIFGAVHVLGFCAQYDIVLQRFVLVGGDALNYARTVKRAAPDSP